MNDFFDLSCNVSYGLNDLSLNGTVGRLTAARSTVCEFQSHLVHLNIRNVDPFKKLKSMQRLTSDPDF